MSKLGTNIYINSPQNRISKIIVVVLKNRSNKIRSNEIRIRQELPVFFKAAVAILLNFISCNF